MRQRSIVKRLTLSLFVTIGSSALIHAVPAGAAVPNAPTSVSASASSAGAVVTWVAPVAVSGVTILGYTVTATPGGQTCTLASRVTPPALSCTVPGVAAATSITFSVTASSAGGTGPAGTYVYLTPAKTSTTLTLSTNFVSPQNVGTPVTVIAWLTAGATGTVDFMLAGSSIAGCTAQVVTSGYALCTITTLASGPNTVTVYYPGDSNFASQTSSGLSFSMATTTLASQATAQSTPLAITTTWGPGNVYLTLATTGGAGSGTVSYSVTNGTAMGCIVTGAKLEMTTGGSCLVTATKASDGTYLPESSNVTTIIFFPSYAAIYGVTSATPIYGCPSGWTLSGSTCSQTNYVAYDYTVTAAQEPNCQYPTGYYNGAYWCGGYVTSTQGATVTGYTYTYGFTCPVGGSDSGYTCTISGGNGPNLRSPRSLAPPLGGAQRSRVIVPSSSLFKLKGFVQ